MVLAEILVVAPALFAFVPPTQTVQILMNVPKTSALADYVLSQIFVMLPLQALAFAQPMQTVKTEIPVQTTCALQVCVSNPTCASTLLAPLAETITLLVETLAVRLVEHLVVTLEAAVRRVETA